MILLCRRKGTNLYYKTSTWVDRENTTFKDGHVLTPDPDEAYKFDEAPNLRIADEYEWVEPERARLKYLFDQGIQRHKERCDG